MDLIEQGFRWHRRFAPPIKTDRQLLLLSELETLLFEAPAVLALSPLLEQGMSLREQVRIDPFAPLPSMMHALSTLIASGHVQTLRAYQGEPYLTPDSQAPLSDGPQWLDQTPVWLLSQAITLEQLQACLHALTGIIGRSASRACTMVVCDDLLDARLAHVDAWHRARQQRWLLLKPMGAEACIGPVFNPAEPDQACWHCLASRLMQQQAGRAWAQGVVLPVRVDLKGLDARLQAMATSWMALLAEPGQWLHTWRDHGHIEHHRPQGSSATQALRHGLIKRPQCAHCGDPAWRAQRQREPIRLRAMPVIAGAPGGSRSLPPEHLVAQAHALVSTLLGPIIELAPLTPAGNDDAPGLTVYRSTFIRPPAKGSALPPHGFVQTCLGKGRTPTQSQASALGEAIERLSALYQGDEAMIVATARELGRAAIPPHALPRVHAAHEPIAPDKPFDADTPASWAPAWSLTHDERRYLPLGHCFHDAPAEDRQHITWTSNGCAAGHHVEEAILQGLLELIERDATAMWWYNRAPRPAWPVAAIPHQVAGMLSHQLGDGWQWWLLDITHDLGVPVAAAVAHRTGQGDQREQQHSEWALGFGCHPDAAIAAERAMTELAQLVAVDKCLHIASGQDTRFLRPASGAAQLHPIGAAMPGHDIAAQIRTLVAHLAARGFDTIVLDHSRPDLPLRAVKATVPGLCHIWPEKVPPARLRDIPVQLGWLTEPAGAAQWNPQALFV